MPTFAYQVSGEYAMMKGAALNGYPNQYSGYGRVQLNQVLFKKENGKTAGDRLFIIDGETVATGEEKVYTIPTRGDDEGFGTEFKAVLVWTDPPAEPISQNPLVNNLDLEVDGQNGNSEVTGGGAPDTVTTSAQALQHSSLSVDSQSGRGSCFSGHVLVSPAIVVIEPGWPLLTLRR